MTKLGLKLNKKMGRCSMKNYESLPLRGFCLSRKVELKSVGCSQHREFCQNKLCLEKFESKCQCYILQLEFRSRVVNIDPVKYVKETLSRVGHVCEINFDPLARHNEFSGCFLITSSR